MSTAVKLNKWERQALSEKLIQLNKKLVMSGKKPLKAESEIVHKIIEMTLAKIEVRDGNLVIE